MAHSLDGAPQDAPNFSDKDKIGLLIGRDVTNIETGTFATGYWMEDCEKSQALLTLDDGPQLLAVGRGGGCSCGQGDFEFT